MMMFQPGSSLIRPNSIGDLTNEVFHRIAFAPGELGVDDKDVS